MKFELVDFYPVDEKNRVNFKNNFLGTVHIYAIDCRLDLRGIKVLKQGRNLFFSIPHMFGFDHETGAKVTYPVFRWEDEQDHKDMMAFLHEEVKPGIMKTVGIKGNPCPMVLNESVTNEMAFANT